MARIILNATEVRSNLFKLIDFVVSSRKSIYIRKDGRVVVKLSPVPKSQVPHQKYERLFER